MNCESPCFYWSLHEYGRQVRENFPRLKCLHNFVLLIPLSRLYERTPTCSSTVAPQNYAKLRGSYNDCLKPISYAKGIQRNRKSSPEFLVMSLHIDFRSLHDQINRPLGALTDPLILIVLKAMTAEN